MDEGVGGVCCRSGVRPWLALSISDLLQHTWQVMVMKLGADRTVNGPGLEARVRIAEGYRGGHIANVMETMLKRWISGEGLSLTA